MCWDGGGRGHSKGEKGGLIMEIEERDEDGCRG